MKLENILNKFLPSAFSPKSVESLANTIEFLGKVIAGLLAIFYVAGLIIFGLYHSALHIRSIELLQVRYLYVGFYYFAFLFLHLALPMWWIKRIWQKIVYLLVILVFTIFLNHVNNIYLSYLVSKLMFGKSYFEFKDYSDILNGDLIVLTSQFLLAPVALFFATVTNKAEKLRAVSIVLLLFALGYNYTIFTTNVFPFIPDAIGGGQSPIVNIVFDKNAPNEVTSNFDIGRIFPGYPGKYYFGQLIYMDGNSVFLKEPFWYSNDVYEVQRKDIIMLNYKEYNPVELGQPGLLP